MTNFPFIFILISSLMFACGAQPKTADQPVSSDDDDKGEIQKIEEVEYKKTTKALMETSEKLKVVEETAKELGWRLKAICADHEDHQACQPYTDAQKAKELFCADKTITSHIEKIIESCHQGQCKQLDSAQEINRNQMLLLLQSLPHLLVLFKANETKLDPKDQSQIQRFLESVDGEKGYVIIVGRASKDGVWKKNISLAVNRAENTRQYLVSEMGLNQKNTGYITYSDQKMLLTDTDAKRLGKKLSVTQANRSAFIFSYPCDIKKK